MKTERDAKREKISREQFFELEEGKNYGFDVTIKAGKEERVIFSGMVYGKLLVKKSWTCTGEPSLYILKVETKEELSRTIRWDTVSRIVGPMDRIP